MSLYVYAIADGAVVLDDLQGVAGESLRVVTSGDGKGHAIAGDFAANAEAAVPSHSHPPALNAETLRTQDALVRELAARAQALLPARFGARFADEPTLRRTLDELGPRLERALTRVRGREQMTIRLFRDESRSSQQSEQPEQSEQTIEPIARGGDASNERNAGGESDAADAIYPSLATDDATLGPGTRYMRERAAAGRQFPEAIEELRAALADAIDDERVERGQSPVIGSIHHLIPRGSADRYRARLDEAAASPRFAASGIRLRVSGPSPAYAFAEADLS